MCTNLTEDCDDMLMHCPVVQTLQCAAFLAGMFASKLIRYAIIDSITQVSLATGQLHSKPCGKFLKVSDDESVKQTCHHCDPQDAAGALGEGAEGMWAGRDGVRVLWEQPA